MNSVGGVVQRAGSSDGYADDLLARRNSRDAALINGARPRAGCCDTAANLKISHGTGPSRARRTAESSQARRMAEPSRVSSGIPLRVNYA